MRLLSSANRIGRAMGTREDLRISAQWQRSELFPLSRRPLCRRGSKLLGKTPNGTGNCPGDCAGGVMRKGKEYEQTVTRRNNRVQRISTAAGRMRERQRNLEKTSSDNLSVSFGR